jgi:hypothetical protein
MRDRWYGDNRDLIKWGGIEILCRNIGMNKVIWVAYLREDSWTNIKFDYYINDKPVPKEVIKHFKSIRENLERLKKDLALNIILIDNECNEAYNRNNRQKYTDFICEYIIKDTDKKRIVFLDPDTGLQPKRISDTTVTEKEVKKIWNTLKNGDYLVFYQHRFFDKEWIIKRKKKLADICGLLEKNVNMWFAQKAAKNNGDSAKLANDVVFYYLEKN